MLNDGNEVTRVMGMGWENSSDTEMEDAVGMSDELMGDNTEIHNGWKVEDNTGKEESTEMGVDGEMEGSEDELVLEEGDLLDYENGVSDEDGSTPGVPRNAFSILMGHKGTTANNQGSSRKEKSTAKSTSKSEAKAKLGQSATAIRARKNAEAYNAGTLVLKPTLYERWKKRIVALDPDAKPVCSGAMKVTHSKCERIITASAPYSVYAFKTHVAGCKIKGPKQFITGFTSSSMPAKSPTSSPPDIAVSVPCVGLQLKSDARIQNILDSPAGGGGGDDIHDIAEEQYGRDFKKLTDKEKQGVWGTYRDTWLWSTDHGRKTVRSTQCKRVVTRLSGETSREAEMVENVCRQCPSHSA